MLNGKSSRPTQDPRNGGPGQLAQQAAPVFAVVPPTLDAGDGWDRGDREACRMVSVNLAAYIDNELDPDQQALVSKHLAYCGACADLFADMTEMDDSILREWRKDTPLPSSSQFKRAVDSIMDALPAVPAEPQPFSTRRVHARVRWTRFATGITGVVLTAGALWSSYRIGYAHGRRSAARSSVALPTEGQTSTAFRSVLSLCSLPPPAPSARVTAALDSNTLAIERERRPQR